MSDSREALIRLHEHWDEFDGACPPGCSRCRVLGADYWLAKGPAPYESLEEWCATVDRLRSQGGVNG